MTIQPSVLIWTILCFCLAMLILDRLLFRPMLAFMDARKKRLTDAKERAAAIQEQAREAELQAAERASRLEEQRRQDNAARLAEAQTVAGQTLSELQKSEQQALTEYEHSLAEQKPALEAAVFAAAEELSELLAGQFLA